MRQFVAIPGDGIGQEVIPAAVRVLMATGAPLEPVTADAGWECFQRTGTALPDATLDAVSRAGLALFGATQSPMERVAGYRSPILELRRRLDLYANLRPVRSLPIAEARRGIDLVIVRENTEGLYAGRERREDDRAIAERLITRRASERIARTAFEIAVQRAAQRQPAGARVTIVHKANVLKETDGLFRETVLEVARAYPTIAVDELLVDAAALRLVRDPESFDVLVTTNLFGDILSDEAAGLVGGLGIAPSGNVGETAAVFEPVHGSAPDIAGKGIANPVAAVLAGALMLDHIGLAAEADRLRVAVDATLDDGVRTPDLGGTASTDQVVQAIIDHLAAPPAPGTHVGTRVL